ncbi:hypothetical protein BDF20DRAFT_841936 [Mycotypha africana]|uniref:uncharacterized protein n=1 Tax=Mycotypha africana TaxID=64632 RepID=UPI002300C07A|nr:uncharacterized protein BDF20DRAFT_841936 [Mycotypha africana]KAI8990966.1 hypothetical protein BDF20DRAFT_841936 [Mycotypha africana]
MGFSQKQASHALLMFDNNLQRAANYLFDTPLPAADKNEEEKDTDVEMDDHDYSASTIHRDTPAAATDYIANDINTQNNIDLHESSVDPVFWKSKALEYQKMALQAKKAGDNKKAISFLRQSKGYDQRYRDLLELQTPAKVTAEFPKTMKEPQSNIQETAKQNLQSQEEKWPSPGSSSLTIPKSISNSPALERQSTPLFDTQKQQELLQKIIPLQKQYKEAAIHYKGLGNFTAAKHMVQVSKELLHKGIQVKNGELLDMHSIELPGPPDMTLGDMKLRPLEPNSPSDYPTSFEQVEAQLQYQLNICHNLSVQSQFTNSSGGNRRTRTSKTLTNTNQQDIYARAKDSIAADLVLLNADKPTIPSTLHYEQVNYTYKNINDTIPDNIMEFKIIRAISLPTLNIATQLDPFATWDFGGWPPENTAQAVMNRGETPVITGTTDPQFNFTMQIPISRTNRLFQRYVQRRKLTIEVFHNKYSYGLFRRPVPLGKITLPMEQLLTKSSISGVFELLDGRKKTGGKVEIQLSLRQPLVGEDIVKRSEKWLVLDYPGSTVSQCLVQAGLTTGGPYSASSISLENKSSLISVVDGTDEKEQQSAVTATQSTLVPTGQQQQQASLQGTKTDNVELRAAEEEFNNVDNIISNMVLEYEINAVTTALATKAVSAKEKEDLQDKKQALEIKMNMLVIQVQTGLLDMDTYLNNLQKRIDADRRLALVFKNYGRLDLARAALLRKKIMQDELDEARAAMAANDEE